jgi:aryl-alcohol dehydrogenase-like predicted oxidoreductase
MSSLPRRPLGASGIDVSIMSLGSWRTYERMSRDDGVAVMRAAREAGIDFLDDARYDDETGTAPIPTGYSEVVFGELFRAAGGPRDQVTIANKLWWEHWPAEDAAAELDGSLGRLGFDHVDLIYAIAPPPELPVAEVVGQVAGLIDAGKARAWGTGMWTAAQLAAAIDECDRVGAPRPVAAQMACSLVDHAQAGAAAMQAALARGDVGLVAANVLAGGILTGKYLLTGKSLGDATGRARADDSPDARRGRQLAARLAELAAEWQVAPVHLAFAYALEHPNLASVVFGATRPQQVHTNVQAVAVHASLSRAQLDAVMALA